MKLPNLTPALTIFKEFYINNRLFNQQFDKPTVTKLTNDFDNIDHKDLVHNLHSQPDFKPKYQEFFRSLSGLYNYFSPPTGTRSVPEVFTELKRSIENFIHGIHKYLASPEFRLRNFIGDFAKPKTSLAPELYQIVS